MSDDFTLIDGFSESFFLINSDHIIVRTNRSARRLFGETITDQPFVRVLRHPQALECLDKTLSTRESTSIQIDLSDFPSSRYRLATYPFDKSDVALILQDISPLIEASKMRSEFVANVSHELRSPLTTLLGLIETLRGAARDDSDRREQFLSVMHTEAMRMDRLIKDLLSLSSVEEHERIIPTSSIDIVSLISDVLSTLESHKQPDQKLIFTPSISSSYILGDEDQLIQVFRNLIQNAINYSSPTGTITLTTEKADNSFLHIHITDEGIGISPSHLPRLTERFYRVDEGRSRHIEGTGLGLAIVKHIMSRHRGTLNISSTLGEGTTITVSFPQSETVSNA